MSNKKNKADKQKLTVYLDPELHTKFKHFCIGKESMTRMVEKLISELLKSYKGK